MSDESETIHHFFGGLSPTGVSDDLVLFRARSILSFANWHYITRMEQQLGLNLSAISVVVFKLPSNHKRMQIRVAGSR